MLIIGHKVISLITYTYWRYIDLISLTTDVSIQSLPMVFRDVLSASLTGPKICGKLIYVHLKSF